LVTPHNAAWGLRKPGCSHLKLCVVTAVRAGIGKGRENSPFQAPPSQLLWRKESCNHETQPVLKVCGLSAISLVWSSMNNSLTVLYKSQPGMMMQTHNSSTW
jgi:hypothetical protein